MARWTLLVAAAYLVIYGTVEPIPVMHQLAALVALLCSLLAGTLTLSRPTSRALRVVAPVADIAAVSVAIAVVGGSIDEFLLFFFIVVMLAGISQRLWLATLGTALVCGVYGGLLYAQGGPEFWHDTHTMIRIPFLFAVGMFFGAVTDISRNETDRIVELSDATRKMVHRYHQVRLGARPHPGTARHRSNGPFGGGPRRRARQDHSQGPARPSAWRGAR